MKLSLLFVTFVAALASSRAQPAFDGYLTTSSRQLFMLSTEQERMSGWITIGQQFDGFVIVEFDPKSELLLVEKDEQRVELQLRKPKVKSSVVRLEEKKASVEERLSRLRAEREAALERKRQLDEMLKKRNT